MNGITEVNRGESQSIIGEGPWAGSGDKASKRKEPYVQRQRRRKEGKTHTATSRGVLVSLERRWDSRAGLAQEQGLFRVLGLMPRALESLSGEH